MRTGVGGYAHGTVLCGQSLLDEQEVVVEGFADKFSDGVMQVTELPRDLPVQLEFEDGDRPLHGEGDPSDPSLLDVMAAYLDVPAPVRNPPETGYFEAYDPYRCPSDIVGKDSATEFKPVWATDGVSYEYFPGVLMFLAESLFIPNPQQAVTQTLRSLSTSGRRGASVGRS